MLTRAERRREERKNTKLAKWLLKLNSDQRQLLTKYCIESTKSDILAFGQAYERVLRVNFQEMFEDELEAEKLLEKIVDEVEQEGLAIRKFENGSVEYMANIKKEKDNIISKYIEAIKKGFNDKEAYEELKTAYPMFTASAIKNVIAEYKRDKKKAAAKKPNNEAEEEIELDPNMDTEEIAKVIVNCGGILESENKANTEENEVKGKIIRQDKKEVLQSVSDVQNSTQKSKLIEITKIREFKGEYGEYKKKADGTIIVGDLEFKNVKDIEDCKEQVDRDLELERQEFEKKISEKRIKALGRLNEVIQLLSM